MPDKEKKENTSHPFFPLPQKQEIEGHFQQQNSGSVLWGEVMGMCISFYFEKNC